MEGEATEPDGELMAWLTQTLPAPLVTQCQRAAEVDPLALSDCVSIVLTIGGPLAKLREVGLAPQESSLLHMTPTELKRVKDQVDALSAVRTLAAELGAHEQAAFVEANRLLDRTNAARLVEDAELNDLNETRAVQAAADASAAATELINLEQQFASLPHPDDLPEGNDRLVAEAERSSVQIMLEYARVRAASTRSIAEVLREAASEWRASSGQLTGQFDQVWRQMLGESARRRAQRRRRERRRGRLRALRLVVGLILSVLIGTFVERLTESLTTSVVVLFAAVVALGLFERKVLEPWLDRHWFDNDADALNEEMVASMCFWVAIRNEQAFINHYAGQAAEPVILIASVLRSTRPPPPPAN